MNLYTCVIILDNQELQTQERSGCLKGIVKHFREIAYLLFYLTKITQDAQYHFHLCIYMKPEQEEGSLRSAWGQMSWLQGVTPGTG